MSRHMVIPAVHLFLIKNNQILLARRFQTGYEDGKYSVPAGHVEAGETAHIALLREAREEVGIVCDETHTQCIQVMCRKNPTEAAERIDFFFVCTSWNGEICNQEPGKCDEVAWFPLRTLPENTIPYVQFAISNYQKSIFYSEFGWNVSS